MNEATLEKMRKMNLFGMYRVFKTSIESGKTENYTPDEMIASLIESEWDDRKNRGIERQLKNARFRYKASIEELQYEADRNLVLAHDVLGELEDRVHGPTPRAVAPGQADKREPAPHPGMRAMACSVKASSGELLARLQRLLETL